MNASDLNKHIEFWKESTAVNTVGTPTETYTFLKKKYANINFKSGTSNYEEMGISVYSTYTFTIRWDSDINYKCRIKYEDSFYLINHIHTLGRNDWMKIECSLYEKELDN